MKMIRIERIGMCEKCPYPHLYLEHDERELGDEVHHSYEIKCKHEDACCRAYDLGLSVIDKLAGLKEGDSD